MMLDRHPVFLRRALAADAAMSGTAGLLMALGAPMLTGLLGLPEGLLREAGVVLLPYAVLIGVLATRERIPVAAAWAVIACNVVWSIDSLVLLASGWVAPTALGIAFTAAQALAVAAFAALQLIGLRRMQAAPA